MFFRSLKEKLKNRRGASITFALLLFLVCAVVGSVVLTAGTAAGGRMSLMTEQDQRYYSVSSAAGLFRDALNGQTWTVTRTETVTEQTETTRTVTYPFEGEPEVTTETKAPVTMTQTYTDAVACSGQTPPAGGYSRSSSLLAKAILDYVYGTLPERDFNSAVSFGREPGAASVDWSLTVTPSDPGAVPVLVTGTMQTDGTIVLTFVNEHGDDEDYFRLQLTLNAAVSDDSAAPGVTRITVPQEDERYVKPTSEDTYDGEGNLTKRVVTTVRIDDVVTTKTTSIRWTAGEVRKVTK